MIKAFLINDCEYIAAHSEEEAVKFYQDELNNVEISEIEIEEIPAEEWPEININMDESEKSESGEDIPIILPFNELMELFSEISHPCMVASKEY